MPPVCRTPGCAGTAAGRLRYCPACDARYEQARSDRDQLAAAARHRHWPLFACLEQPEASTLAEHVVGNARIGRGSVMYAIADYLAEACERHCAMDDTAGARRPLRVIRGGAA
jgi:hypothetical protein